MTHEESIKKSIEIAVSTDWSNPLFRGAYHQTLTCAHCNTEYRGHGKGIRIYDECGLISKDGCPHCGGHGLQHLRADIDVWNPDETHRDRTP